MVVEIEYTNGWFGDRDWVEHKKTHLTARNALCLNSVGKYYVHKSFKVPWTLYQSLYVWFYINCALNERIENTIF